MKIAQGSGASRTCFYFGSIFGIQSIVGAGFKVFDTTGTDLSFLDHANLADVAVEVHGAAAICVVVFAYIAGFRRQFVECFALKGELLLFAFAFELSSKLLDGHTVDGALLEAEWETLNSNGSHSKKI